MVDIKTDIYLKRCLWIDWSINQYIDISIHSPRLPTVYCSNPLAQQLRPFQYNFSNFLSFLLFSRKFPFLSYCCSYGGLNMFAHDICIWVISLSLPNKLFPAFYYSYFKESTFYITSFLSTKLIVISIAFPSSLEIYILWNNHYIIKINKYLSCTHYELSTLLGM